MRIEQATICLLGATLLVGCEPASVTEARNQLRRGPTRSIEYSLPITRDTLTMAEVFANVLNVQTIALLDDILGVSAGTKGFGVAVADTLGSVTGVLNPAVLNFAFEDVVELDVTDFNLGEFESAVRDASLNVALAAIRLSNTANAPLRLSNFTLGVVRLDNAGQPLRDGSGNLQYEVDGSANPILVDVVDVPGGSSYTIGRSRTERDTLQAAALVDRLIDLVLDGDRAGLAASGTIAVGDGTTGSLVGGDRLDLLVNVIIGLDLSAPAMGVSFDTSLVSQGLDVGAQEADDIAARLDSARVELEVGNGTPFGLQVEVAVIRGAVIGNVFTTPGRLIVDTLLVSSASVDALGRVTQSTDETVTFSLTGTEARELFGEEFSIGIKVTLLPPTGGRGAIQVTNLLGVRAAAGVFVRAGESQ